MDCRLAGVELALSASIAFTLAGLVSVDVVVQFCGILVFRLALAVDRLFIVVSVTTSSLGFESFDAFKSKDSFV